MEPIFKIKKTPHSDEMTDVTLWDMYLQSLIASGVKDSLKNLMKMSDKIIQIRDEFLKKKTMN